MKKSFYLLILSVITFTLYSFGGGSNGKIGKNSGGSGGSTCSTVSRKIQIMTMPNVSQVPLRSSFFTFMPAGPFLGNQGLKSATSLYDSPLFKVYCFITVTATGCSSYGTKTFLWDGGNDGNTDGRDMNIDVPNTGNYTVSVDLHEVCGNFYSGSNPTKRAMFVYQQSHYPGSNPISITSWMFNRTNNC